MDCPTAIPLRIGAWCVNPTSGQISREGETVRVEARTMRLLLCLAERPGEVVSIDDLLDRVWSGVIVTPDSVYQAVASLRRLLGDDAKQPAYIATVPRLGYRMVATVAPWADPVEPMASAPPPGLPGETPTVGVAESPAPGPNRRAGALVPVGAVLGLALTVAFLFYGKVVEDRSAAAAAGAPQRSVADVAKSLGVAYVVDGSVRKSRSMLRIAARLIRADDGYVVWSETYDRPFDDKLAVQDDIASEVTKALKASIH